MRRHANSNNNKMETLIVFNNLTINHLSRIRMFRILIPLAEIYRIIIKVYQI